MPSPAQRVFNQQSPEEQEKILATAPSIEAWFNAAVKAGVYNPDGSHRMGTEENPEKEWRGGYNAQGVDASGMRAWAQQHSMSEDFDRFDEATLALWKSKLDPSCPPKFPFRSNNNTGCAEKPIDSGLDAPGRGRAKRPMAPKPEAPVAAAEPTLPPLFDPDNPLQNRLLALFQGGGLLGQGEGAIGRSLKGGGMWWADDAQQRAALGKPPPGLPGGGAAPAAGPVAPGSAPPAPAWGKSNAWMPSQPPGKWGDTQSFKLGNMMKRPRKF